ncbi:MAG: hypothetical protein ACU84J_16695 [Gammaproteobacteria bacterium]
MPNFLSFFKINKRNAAFYALPAFLMLAVWSGPVPAVNPEACEHAASQANLSCDSQPVAADLFSIPEPAVLTLLGAGVLIWFGLTHRKNR